jgi:PKD repeat protein
MRIKKVLGLVFVLLVGAKGLWASLNFSPASPRTGETVTFTLSPSKPLAGSITWDFGDGSPGQSGTSLTVTHVYAAVGSYTAKATYLVVQSPIPVTDQATVQITNPRQISFAPPQPKAGQAMTFSAISFYSSCIQWDFGDGTV